MPGTSGAKTALRAFCPDMTESFCYPKHSFRRAYLNRAGTAAAVARGIVHVLDIGLRQHVFAWRYRAHHVRHREHGLVVAGAIDGRREAVVAELGIFRLLAILDPVQRARVT